jgi:hypothetical protein
MLRPEKASHRRPRKPRLAVLVPVETKSELSPVYPP